MKWVKIKFLESNFNLDFICSEKKISDFHLGGCRWSSRREFP